MIEDVVEETDIPEALNAVLIPMDKDEVQRFAPIAKYQGIVSQTTGKSNLKAPPDLGKRGNSRKRPSLAEIRVTEKKTALQSTLRQP